MKKWLLALAIALLMLASGALADELGSFGTEKMPAEIHTLLAESRWNGWEITGWAHPEDVKTAEACAFAVVKQGSQNVLLAFGWGEAGWVVLWDNPAALPQVEAPIALGSVLNRGRNFSSLYVVNGESYQAFCVWMPRADGEWHLSSLLHHMPLTAFDASMQNALFATILDVPEDQENALWALGAYETNARYFDFAEFPTTVEEMHTKMGNLRIQPAQKLKGRQVAFAAGERYAVYQGPGEAYGQAANGKALVSTNDWIQVYGEENGWILIRYQVAERHMRYGWIPARALPDGEHVEALVYQEVAARTLRAADMTDDPEFSRAVMLTIPEGAKVRWLSLFWDHSERSGYAYVEYSDGHPVRGFVSVDALEVIVEKEIP
ncbi:MAG: hypothetical protein LBN04_07195 [Oscillospiraceae bacterium]|jgi:hypothetical protein|nr:hypothetical protein [Oscillospiraceae bacterium]